ncbi:hypothetical protein DUD97_03565 [Salmonella enterica subsp. enterica serovar Pomona]|nr:hypothetical protein [Salmonella enterica subsp. enterica serovar Pomona]
MGGGKCCHSALSPVIYNVTISQYVALYQYTSTKEIKKAPIVTIGAVYFTLRCECARSARVTHHRRNDGDR